MLGEGGTGTGSVLGLIEGVCTEPDGAASEFVAFIEVIFEVFLEASVLLGTSCLCFD